MNKIIFIMIAFIAGIAVGNTGKPHVVDRYAIEYHHGTTTDDIGLVKMSLADIEEAIR